MKRDDEIDIELIKAQLQGSNFKKLLKKKNVTKYQISKDCNIAYRTLSYWQAGVNPSDDLALKVGKYLGLITPDKHEILKVKQEMEKLQARLDRLEKV